MHNLSSLADRMLWRLEELSKTRFQTKAKQGFDVQDSVWGCDIDPYKQYKKEKSFSCSAYESRIYGDYKGWGSIRELEKSAIEVFGTEFERVWSAFVLELPYKLRISVPPADTDFTAKNMYCFVQRDIATVCVLIELGKYDIIEEARLFIKEKGCLVWPDWIK
jgi:hypothetical protein